MNRLITIPAIIFIAIAVSGCAGQPSVTGSTQVEQRTRSEKAQDELSSAVKK